MNYRQLSVSWASRDKKCDLKNSFLLFLPLTQLRPAAAAISKGKIIHKPGKEPAEALAVIFI
jgi:hypothetical protein